MAWEEILRTEVEGVTEVTSTLRIAEGMLYKVSSSWSKTKDGPAGKALALTLVELTEQTKSLRPQIRGRVARR